MLPPAITLNPKGVWGGRFYRQNRRPGAQQPGDGPVITGDSPNAASASEEVSRSIAQKPLCLWIVFLMKRNPFVLVRLLRIFARNPAPLPLWECGRRSSPQVVFVTDQETADVLLLEPANGEISAGESQSGRVCVRFFSAAHGYLILKLNRL